VRDQYVRTLAGECDRDRPADAGVAAGDHRFLALEAPEASVAVLAVIRFEVHLLCAAGILDRHVPAAGRVVLLVGSCWVN